MDQNSDNEQKSLKEVWIITVGHGMTHWYPATFFLILPIIGREFGLTYTEIGFIISFQYLASSLSNIPGGMIVDTVGRKAFLMAAALFWVGFPYLLMSFTQSYWMLLLCVAFVGIGNNIWHPSAIPTLSQRFPTRKGFVLSLHGMGANIGDALAPLVVGILLATLEWRQVVVINVVPGIIMSVVILVLLRHLQLGPKTKQSDRRKEEGQSLKEYWTGLKSLFRNRSLLIISASSGFRSMTQNVLYTFLPLYLAYELLFTEMWIGISLFALQAAGFIAAPLSGNLSDRLGRKKVIMGSASVTALVLIAMASFGQSKFFIAFIAILGFFLYAIRPVMQAWLMDTTPRKLQGTSIGVLFGVQSIFSSLSPFVAGVIADSFGLFATFYFITGTILAANFLVFFMPDQKNEDVKPSISA